MLARLAVLSLAAPAHAVAVVVGYALELRRRRTPDLVLPPVPVGRHRALPGRGAMRSDLGTLARPAPPKVSA